ARRGTRDCGRGRFRHGSTNPSEVKAARRGDQATVYSSGSSRKPATLKPARVRELKADGDRSRQPGCVGEFLENGALANCRRSLCAICDLTRRSKSTGYSITSSARPSLAA